MTDSENSSKVFSALAWIGSFIVTTPAVIYAAITILLIYLIRQYVTNPEAEITYYEVFASSAITNLIIGLV